jgi:integral membrane protein (TIGR00529 family)
MTAAAATCTPAGAVAGLLLAVTLIIVLVRFRADLGLSLFAGAAVVGLFSGLGVVRVLLTLGRACVARPTVELVFVIAAIMLLAEMSSHFGYLETFARALQRLVSDRRVSLSVMPAFGGLLPMPGGAMWSAPLVQNVDRESEISPEQRTFVNYWFRHVWEYVLPVYPGLVLASAILSVPIVRLVRAQAPLSAASIVAGAIVVYVTIKKGKPAPPVSKASRARALPLLLSGIWPFAFVLILVLGFKANLLAVLVTAVVLMLILTRTGLRAFGGLAWQSFSPASLSVVLGVMGFKEVMTAGGVVDVFPSILAALHIPNALVLFFIPMIVGLLTGITQAFVGVAFPVVMPFITGADSPLSAATLAYAGGFLGVQLSPVHLCLILTYQYFKARLGGVYRLMIFPVVFVAVVAFALALR